MNQLFLPLLIGDNLNKKHKKASAVYIAGCFSNGKAESILKQHTQNDSRILMYGGNKNEEKIISRFFCIILC